MGSITMLGVFKVMEGYCLMIEIIIRYRFI
jgi:hypothetical protein